MEAWKGWKNIGNFPMHVASPSHPTESSDSDSDRGKGREGSCKKFSLPFPRVIMSQRRRNSPRAASLSLSISIGGGGREATHTFSESHLFTHTYVYEFRKPPSQADNYQFCTENYLRRGVVTYCCSGTGRILLQKHVPSLVQYFFGMILHFEIPLLWIRNITYWRAVKLQFA